jgi:pseudaminic acid cytidylyltransferase
MTICIIPARLNSKRIKEKNIKILNGKPLLGHVIKILKATKIFSRIIVSTDSKKIADIAKKYGAEVPFLRSKKLANDFTPIYKVLIDCVKKIKTEENPYHFCVYPTSIFVKKGNLKKAFSKIKKTKSKAIITIKKYNSPPLRSLKIKKNKIYYNFPKYEIARSQDLDDFYYDTGSFYIYETKALLKLKKKQQFPKKTTYLILDKTEIDINTEDEFRLAKKLFKS